MHICKKLLSFLIIIAIISSCKQSTTTTVTTNNPTSNQTTDSAIQSYVNAFQTKYNRIVSLPVYFDTSSATGGSSSSGTTIGVCRIYTNGYREILINQDWWNCKTKIGSSCVVSRPDNEKRILIFHELGHCVFDRDHDFEYTSSNQKICLSTDGNGTCTNYKYRVFSNNAAKPISMMYPVINNIADYYVIDQTRYYYELQNPYPQSWDTSNLTAWNQDYSDYVSRLAMADNTYTNNSYSIISSAMTDASSQEESVPTYYEYSSENKLPTHSGDCVQFIK